MPTTKSAKKRLRQSLTRRASNRATRSVLKTHVRKVRDAVAAADAAAAGEALRVTAKKLDQAAAHGVIHANSAARLKSRLSAAIKAVKDQKKKA
jgi:small subunit ribosomal protein S20